MNPLVLVGCGDTKRDTRQPVWALYDSNYYKKKLTFAMLAGTPAILSAKHGLVWPTERVDPYDESLTNATRSERREWAEKVLAEIPPRFDDVIILAGKDYREPLVGMLEDRFRRSSARVHSPFDGTEGFGEQQGWLTSANRKLVEGVAVEVVLP